MKILASSAEVSAWSRALSGSLVVSLCALGLSFSACTKSEDTGGGMGAATPAAPPETPRASSQPDPGDDGPLTDPPAPPKATGNPLQGLKLWVDPQNNAKLRANGIRGKSPDKAAILDKIGNQPQALWLGEWNTNIYRTAAFNVQKAKDEGAVAQFVAYNVPHRDCGQQSAGGLKTGDMYRHWIRRFAAGIGQEPVIVVLEPDAIPLLEKANCLSKEQQDERLALIKDAMRVLRQNPKAVVYLDAGHAHWDPAETFAPRLVKAGVAEAHGFALNTSNYVSTDENIAFGKKLSKLLGGSTHFIIDTSRNGNGSTPDNQWCNPPGRKLGKAPTLDTGDPLIDGFLWMKRPGESDGADSPGQDCHGGPKAGVFWEEQAIEMAK
ncbi:MAG TPA: glycoside hydrolase family 6 protein [Polyangiaceae bacterium]|jgi:endoglucanase